MKYGGIELGGTKIVYGIGDESGLLERYSIPTADPNSTLTKIQEYFREKKIVKLGIATFGPVISQPEQSLRLLSQDGLA